MYFYTQKCVFCKDVLPVVESIANNGEFKVAKVDGEAETKIIVQMNVTAYPTLWVVRKGQPDARPYTGPRKEADIVSFLKRSASPILSDVSDESKISELAKAVPSVVVGTFTEESSDESIEFDEVATTFRGEFIFGRILDKSAQPSVKLYRHHGGFADEEMLVTYQGAFTSDAIAKWVESESVPLADELSADTVHRYLSKSKPFVTMFYDSNKAGAREEALQLLTPLGRKYRGKMFFLVLDARELSDQLESYGLQYSPLPSMVVDKLDNNGFFKFRGQMNQEPMSEWIGEILEDKIKPQRKSQDFVKPRDTMPVYPLAFSEWEKLVAKRDKAVIVEFWAPWCGFCKNFAPTYKAVGKKIMALGLNSTIMVASMDMTQNELPDGVTLDGYPTVLLFPKSRRAKPISYDGDFSGKDVLAFIKERLSTKKSKRQKPQVMSGIVGETVDFDKKNAKPANEEL
jgi:protein disulfide-isomerase A1